MMNCCNFLMGGPWTMFLGSIVWLLVIALLVLGIIALWKFITKK